MNKFICFLLIFLCPVFIMAGEFGLVVNQYGKTLDSGGNSFSYNANIMPRFLQPLGSPGNYRGSLFVSAGGELRYTDDFYFVPELLRTEFTMQWDNFGIIAGRFAYSAPLPFIVDGLFDGAQVSYSSQAGRFRIGAWYTGFLYKNSATIAMTEHDRDINGAPLDYNDFAGTYFAPKRLLASIDWEHFAVADILRLNAAITAQFDLGDGLEDDQKYNSQYFSLKAGMPVNSLFFTLGGGLSASQTGGSFNNLSYAGEFDVFFNLPSSFSSRISFNAHYASGKIEDKAENFIPVTVMKAGNIFDAGMSALTVLGLEYYALFTKEVGASISAKYFISNDEAADNKFSALGDGNGENMLGAEIFARLIWGPFSDLHFNLGGGAFIGALGNNWPDSQPVWLVELTAIFTIY